MANTNDDVKPATPTPATVADQTCPRCGLWVVRGENHTCGTRAEPDPDRLAAIKAAIAPPPPERPVEDVDLPEESADA